MTCNTYVDIFVFEFRFRSWLLVRPWGVTSKGSVQCSATRSAGVDLAQLLGKRRINGLRQPNGKLSLAVVGVGR